MASIANIRFRKPRQPYMVCPPPAPQNGAARE
jgi:hypothetical protein